MANARDMNIGFFNFDIKSTIYELIHLSILRVICHWIVNKKFVQNLLRDFGQVEKMQQMDEQGLSQCVLLVWSAKCDKN